MKGGDMASEQIKEKKEIITWLVCEVERLNEILKIGSSNETGEDSDAPLASLAPLVSL